MRPRAIADVRAAPHEDCEERCRRAGMLGFDAMLVSDAEIFRADSGLQAAVDAARAHGLAVLVDVDLRSLDAQAPIVREHPAWFRADVGDPDPRMTALPAQAQRVRLRGPVSAPLAESWERRLREALAFGVAGFCALRPHRDPGAWGALLSRLRADAPAPWTAADTSGVTPEELALLADAGFDAALSSLAWWDGSASWYFDEERRLRGVAAQVLARIEDVQRGFLPTLGLALCDGLLARLPCSPVGERALAHALHDHPPARPSPRALRPLLRARGDVSIVLVERSDGSDLVVANLGEERIASLGFDEIAEEAGIGASALRLSADASDGALVLAPGECRTLRIVPEPLAPPGRAVPPPQRANAARARLVIEAVTPQLDGGRFAAKRCVGDKVRVGADIYADGHERLAAALLWRRKGDQDWRRSALRAGDNDHWHGEFSVESIGRYEFAIEAWKDEFATLRGEVDAKLRAGVLAGVDVQDARCLIDTVRSRSSAASAALQAVLDAFDRASDDEARARVVLGADAAHAMAQAGERPFLTRTAAFPLDVERLRARYASWYELFPRSFGPAGSHGSLDDVVAHLPRIRAMGFDVLYLPPIHPIGERFRKGRNNRLEAEIGDPGSPYAIGSSQGGHLAVHPELGGIEAFRRLLAAARDAGMEIALDFAIQASPDHPWLRQHPEWFTTRSDGTIRHAENPPKKYQDIVNVDFYAEAAIPSLWKALRDVVEYWAGEGVRIFRVDNPHTKPFPFWEWLIASVRARFADVIFLAEAFTRPKPMYRLGKIGFSQSYTYFTWRNTKAELESYVRELAGGEPRECFRPHFFVNTPDINPHFLQAGGRPAHLIRAALATTLSGLWGMYSGFELCEAEGLPGREEYADSEKYELKSRDWNRAGHIVAEIARLNFLRRIHPELQTHLDVEFLRADNDSVLYFAKGRADAGSVVLVAISLDPQRVQGTTFEVPLWRWGLAEHAAVAVEDLWTDERFEWKGMRQHVELAPARPFALWRVTAPTPSTPPSAAGASP
jgi:starch synthase (maltosyl-transferring)